MGVLIGFIASNSNVKLLCMGLIPFTLDDDISRLTSFIATTDP